MESQLSDQELYESLKRLERFAHLSDDQYQIPFTKIRLGLDSLIGFIPIIGDFIGLIMSLYLFKEASRLGAPRSLKLKMLLNIAIDWAIGFIPIIGDLADIAYKSNMRNVRLLVEHIDKQHRQNTLSAATENNNSFNTNFLVTTFFITTLILVSGMLLYLSTLFFDG